MRIRPSEHGVHSAHALNQMCPLIDKLHRTGGEWP